ncbi:MAG TPA: glycine oxidase ThiO [Blastocatellia bacterium]
MTEGKDAIVIGGGIIGCSIAVALAHAGMKVTVLERGRAGEEASWAAAGMLSPQTDATGKSPFFDLCMASRSMYPDFAAKMQALSGIDPCYQDDGILCLALTEDEAKKMAGWSAWQKRQGLTVEYISGGGVFELAPAVTRSARAGTFIPGDHQVDNRRLTEAVIAAARQAGVEIIEGTKVEGLDVHKGTATGVRCKGQVFSGGAVIMAAGCWSGDLLQNAGMNIPVVPARGQMLALRGPERPFGPVIHGTKCYLVPRRDNRVLVGSTIEYVGFHKAITAGSMAWLLSSAIALVPSLERFEVVETWSGLRPDTPDHLPVLGQCEVENLYLATGHFRNGILLAPITARLITECLTSGRTSIDIQPFSPERFHRSSDRMEGINAAVVR